MSSESHTILADVEGAVASDVLIRATGVSKAYRIWRNPGARLQSIAMHCLKRAVPPLQKLISIRQTQLYRDFYALEDLDLEIRRGESLGVIGRNGSGKSTLLQILAGTLSPTSGYVECNARVAALLELGSGFNPEFTGRENVLLNASIYGLSPEEIAARMDRILGFADIGNFVDQPVKTYSSGMMMRLAFAVIANVDADLLIVDEALAVGDVFFVQKCMRYIRAFLEKGSLLLVTHDTAALTSLCQNAIWLNKGRCSARGSAAEVARHYLEATFEDRQNTRLEKNERRSFSSSQELLDQYDQRRFFLNASTLRNDIEVFRFQSNSSEFGDGSAQLTQVVLLDAINGRPLFYIVGGERVILRITACALRELVLPIIGFHLKNGFGQELFGDNTFLTHHDTDLGVSSGQSLAAEFHFVMPFLPAGTYVFDAAIASGTQADHVQHHWLHEALVLKSHSSHVVGGLVGIPMLRIKLSLSEELKTETGSR